MDRPSIVKFQNVSLSYGAGAGVFSDINFRLASGSFTFLTGASGAGKTSIMKMIYLALKPTAGTVSLFGDPTSEMKNEDMPFLRRKIGIVLQDFKLLDHLSTFDNVALPLHIRGLSIEDYRRDIEELLDWVGLSCRMMANPSILSGGEKQRVAIARAVIARPELILADEPTGNVDPEMADRLMKLFVELNRLGTTILIATHDTYLIERFPANVLRLSGGGLWGMPYRKFMETMDHHKGKVL
jgi:cell division transport system ATP-binding protein